VLIVGGGDMEEDLHFLAKDLCLRILRGIMVRVMHYRYNIECVGGTIFLRPFIMLTWTPVNLLGELRFLFLHVNFHEKCMCFLWNFMRFSV
jgi:hypothetical protein